LDWREIAANPPLESAELTTDKPTDKLNDTSHIANLANISASPSSIAGIDKRHYGLNQSSHQYCAQRAAEILEQDLKDLRLITCNLDGGCSLAAIHNGQIIDTATGFTPLEGLMIDYSSGSIDPDILNQLMRQEEDTDDSSDVDKESENNTSKLSADPRSVDTATDTDNSRAKQSLDIYIHRLRSCLGSMLMVLGGMDALIFTAELGESSEIVRELICQSLEFLGLKLDLEQNQNNPVDSDIATTESKVRVLVIQTQAD
jgi:acetate kinase